MKIKTVLFNDTPFEILLHEGRGNVYTRVIEIPAGGKHVISVDPSATYREYLIEVVRPDQDVEQYQKLKFFNSDDGLKFKKVRFMYVPPYDVVSLKGIYRDGRVYDQSRHDLDGIDAALKNLKNEVSSKFNAASRSCIGLKKLLGGVKICQKQCNHLVQTCVMGVEKMTELYSRAAEDALQIWRLYNAGRLSDLYNHLTRLEHILGDAEDLLGASVNDLRRVALVVSMPMPPEKDMEVSSVFDLLLGELMWNLDLIEHVLQPAKSVKLAWSSAVRRYALDGSRNVNSVHMNSSTMISEDVPGSESAWGLEKDCLHLFLSYPPHSFSCYLGIWDCISESQFGTSTKYL